MAALEYRVATPAYLRPWLFVFGLVTVMNQIIKRNPTSCGTLICIHVLISQTHGQS